MTIPMTIAITVSSSVISRPVRMALSVKYWPTTPHSNRRFVATLLTAAARAIRTSAVPIQRPGCRAGTALIRSAGTRVAASTPEVGVVASAYPLPAS